MTYVIQSMLDACHRVWTVDSHASSGCLGHWVIGSKFGMDSGTRNAFGRSYSALDGASPAYISGVLVSSARHGISHLCRLDPLLGVATTLRSH
jgi:hypothetical protein